MSYIISIYLFVDYVLQATQQEETISKHPLSSISANGSVGKSVPPLSTVVSEGSATHPKKAPKSVAGSSVHSSSQSALKGILLQQVRRYNCITEGLEVIPGCCFY